MWDKKETIAMMKALQTLHTGYQEETLSIRKRLFDYLEKHDDPSIAARIQDEDIVFSLKKEGRHRVPTIANWPIVGDLGFLKYKINQTETSLLDSMSVDSTAYMIKAHANPEKIKERQIEILSLICRFYEAHQIPAFLVFCEEMKRWVVNLPTLTSGNYKDLSTLIKLKIDYLYEIIDQEIFPIEETNGFLLGLVEEIKLLATSLFENYKDTSIIKDLFDLKDILHPLSRHFLLFLQLILRKDLPFWASDKEPIKSCRNFKLKDIYSSDAYIQKILNPIYHLQSGEKTELSIASLDFLENEPLFCNLFWEISEASSLITGINDKQDKGFLEILSTYFKLHKTLARFIKIYQAVTLLHDLADGMGRLYFYAVLKDSLYYIFSELNAASNETVLYVETIYDQLRTLYNGITKEKNRCDCLSASKDAFKAIKAILTGCQKLEYGILEKLSNYSYDFDIRKCQEEFIKLADLLNKFETSDGFYSALISSNKLNDETAEISLYGTGVISKNPYNFYNARRIENEQKVLIDSIEISEDVTTLDVKDSLHESRNVREVFSNYIREISSYSHKV